MPIYLWESENLMFFVAFFHAEKQIVFWQLVILKVDLCWMIWVALIDENMKESCLK